MSDDEVALFERRFALHDLVTALRVSAGTTLTALGAAAIICGWPALGITGVIAGVSVACDALNRQVR